MLGLSPAKTLRLLIPELLPPTLHPHTGARAALCSVRTVCASRPNPSRSPVDVCKLNSNERCLWRALQMVGPLLRAYRVLTQVFLTPYKGARFFFLGFIFHFLLAVLCPHRHVGSSRVAESRS